MENVEWIFSGIGTEVLVGAISLIVGAIGGGAVGYRIGSKNKINQSQNAGNNSQQKQIGSVNYYGEDNQNNNTQASGIRYP